MCRSTGGTVVVVVSLLLFFVNVKSQESERPIFSCQGRPSGYYADIQSGCQIYHMCDGLGRQFSYSCPNTTLFQQRMLICDHWYMVNCSKAELDYGANLLIGQRGKPFVEDDEEHPYHRTPRPDLLAHPSASEYNIIYRTGRVQQDNRKNLVGADVDDDEEKVRTKTSDQPAYFLPSHWSTEYSADTTEKQKVKTKTKKSEAPVVVNFKSSFKATTPVYPKVAPPEAKDDFVPNLPPGPAVTSTYKATTPVYPKIAPPEAKDEFALDLSPVTSNYKATTPVYPKVAPPEANKDFSLEAQDAPLVINFKSNFKATTPVYPKTPPTEVPILENDYSQNQPKQILQAPAIDPELREHSKPVVVNFESNFKATTPVYPKFVTPEKPLSFEEQPQQQNGVPYGIATIIEPPRDADDVLGYPVHIPANVIVNFESSYKATTPVYPEYVTPEQPLAIQETRVDPNKPGLSTVIQPPRSFSEDRYNTVQEPSIYYQPPVVKESRKRQSTPRPSKSDSNDWTELRRTFKIPEYDFPLDASAVRPSYDQGPSSFQVNPFSYEVMPRDHA